MQIRLTEDAFVRLVMPAPPGARDPSPRIRYAFRVIPKGERTDTPHTFFIGRETMRVLVTVATMLAEHYGLPPGAPLPTVAFDPCNARAHRFGPAPYLFQYAGRHLAAADITACMRFLLHGLVFRTRDGQAVVLTAHLLRHAFATHAVQVEKIPVDIVGEWLKQKQLDVTDVLQSTDRHHDCRGGRSLSGAHRRPHPCRRGRPPLPARIADALRGIPRQGRHPGRGDRGPLRQSRLLRGEVRLRRLRREGPGSRQASPGRTPAPVGDGPSASWPPLRGSTPKPNA